MGAGADELIGNPVAACKLTAATNAVIAACDTIDGVKDGVIEDPTTGAKGLNLTASDVLVLARAFKRFFETGSADWLDEYSDLCLRLCGRRSGFPGG